MSYFSQSPTDESQPPTDAVLEELLSGYVLNALSPEEAAKLEAQLAANPKLRQKMDEFQEIMGLMADSSRMTAPAELRSKVLAIPHTPGLAQTLYAEPTPQIAPLTAGQWRSRLAWQGGVQKIGAAIAALLLIALGVNNYLLYQRLTFLEAEVAEHQAESNYTFELKSRKPGSTAVATVLLDLEAGKVLVGVRGLAPLSADEAYYLWAFTANQKKILCGRFNTDSSGQLVQQLSISSEEYGSPIEFMRISREPAVTPSDAKRRILVLTSEL